MERMAKKKAHEAMLKGEINNHLGYENTYHGSKNNR